MPTNLNHSPADIVRHALIDTGYGSLPPTNPWPIYCNGEVTSPDNILVVSDTTGKLDNRNHVDGAVDEHHGVQIKIRATSTVVGYPKASALARAIDQIIKLVNVTIGADSYCIHSLSRTSPILALGEELGTSKRVAYTINFLVCLVDT